MSAPVGEARPRRDGVLRFRLLAAFAALSLMPLFASNGIGYIRSRDINDELVERYLDGIAGLQAAHVQDRLDQRFLYLQAIGSANRFLQAAAERGGPGANPGMSEAADPGAVRQYLRRKLEESGRFDVLALFHTDGRPIASTNEARPLSLPSVEPAGLSLLRSPDGTTAPSLFFTVPVENVSSEAVAYLVATVPLERGTELLEIPEHVAGAIESFIVDEGGLPIFVSHPHGHLDYDHRLESPQVRLPPGSNARYLDREGIEVIGASAKLPQLDWTFITEVPVADAAAELNDLRTLSLILGSAFSVLVLVAAWLLAGGIVAPVGRLVAATRRLGAGDLEVRVPSVGNDEIGELSEAFNDMAQDLAESQARIKALHQREIERAEQLATVGELASGLAHEIKNPVVGISNGLDLIARRVVGDPESDAIAAEMKRQLDRIEHAVGDLLSYAKPTEPELAPASLNEAATRAVTLTAPAAQKVGVSLSTQLEENLPIVHADGELLAQAVVNLVINAIQFSPEGSTVSITSDHDESEVRLHVRDEGPGMESDTLRRLFRPFFTTRHSGTGLGLSITRGIVERHGGRIEVDSTPGEGSRFTLVLPAKGETP